ncbi:MAG: YtxH domain-containing protein [Vampirovibrio sp.]|nr:YtxH domain-containing protein [Vampirovibrio sp.]
MCFGRFVFGAMVGGAIGAGVALLLAPRSGEDTRALIRDEMDERYQQAKETVQEKADEVSHTVQHKLEEAKDRVDSVKSTVREKTDEWSEKAKDLADELEEIGRKTVKKVSGPENAKS